MQLLLSLGPEPSNPPEPSPNVWQTLAAEQRRETLAVLTRLLAKTVAANASADTARERKEDEHE
jgi:hypothetical protein